jgi:hypothetical protein
MVKVRASRANKAQRIGLPSCSIHLLCLHASLVGCSEDEHTHTRHTHSLFSPLFPPPLSLALSRSHSHHSSISQPRFDSNSQTHTPQTHTNTHTRTYTRTYIHTYIHTDVHTHVHTYIRTRTYVYTHTRAHTHTHTPYHLRSTGWAWNRTTDADGNASAESTWMTRCPSMRKLLS